MILSRPWLTKSHAKNYLGEGYMTIGVHPNQQKIPFVNFVESSRGMNEYDESKIDQSSDFEKIYTYDSNEKEVRLYGLETIPKVGVLFRAYQRVRRDNNQSIPRVLTKGKLWNG